MEVQGANGRSKSDEESIERKMRVKFIVEQMNGKEMTIVIKGPGIDCETHCPIIYGRWSFYSTEIHDILCKCVARGCNYKVVDSNSNVQTQNGYYINEYKKVEKENDPTFDMWVVKENGLQTSTYYYPNKGKKYGKFNYLFDCFVIVDL